MGYDKESGHLQLSRSGLRVNTRDTHTEPAYLRSVKYTPMDVVGMLTPDGLRTVATDWDKIGPPILHEGMEGRKIGTRETQPIVRIKGKMLFLKDGTYCSISEFQLPEMYGTTLSFYDP